MNASGEKLGQIWHQRNRGVGKSTFRLHPLVNNGYRQEAESEAFIQHDVVPSACGCGLFISGNRQVSASGDHEYAVPVVGLVKRHHPVILMHRQSEITASHDPHRFVRSLQAFTHGV